MEKRIKLDNGNIIIFDKNPSYCCDTIMITEGYINNNELVKNIQLSIWDDICFNAYTKDSDNNYIEFIFDINHPLYFCIKHLLDNDKELIIDDDDTYSRLDKYMILKKEEDNYKIIFYNNIKDIDYNHNKFRVFIKNIGPDCRSKINDFSIKYKIVEFFREMEKVLLEEYHQITLEEHLEFNKVKKRIKSR